ncbi:MAG: hypothetical protein WB902_29620, partial [Acetobacteraceae bacterium]
MSVTAVTYWKGGKAGDIVAAAKKAKAIFAKHGAQNFQLNRVHAGPDAGQWAVVTTFSDWASYGMLQQALAGDLLAQVSAMSELTSRRIVVSVDLQVAQ